MIQALEVKRDEQYPLLKVDSGAGNTILPQPPSTIMTPGWNVACVPKRSWQDRWPEFISACWMTLILLGITFLVFYALGMSAYRRQPLMIQVNFNSSKPENNMFFHHIVPRGSFLPFTLYSDYLSNMAVEYPFIHINVFFLIDDSLHTTGYGSKHLMFKRFSPSMLTDAYTINERDKQELKIFQQRHGNVNVTIMPLSYYMAMTPLRYKWKMIPIYYLPFYARIYAVWAYGGIGLDLTTFNNKYNNQMLDRRITAILKQHNDGIEEKKYIQTLNTINCEEQTELSNLFYSLISSIFNNTFSFFDSTLFNPPVTFENSRPATVSRNYRNKRNLGIVFKNTTDEVNGNGKIVNDNVNRTKVPSMIESELYATLVNSTWDNTKKTRNNSLISVEVKENTTAEIDTFKNIGNALENKLNVTKIGTEGPHIVLFYDVSLLSDGVGPAYLLPEVFESPKPILKNNIRREATRKSNRPPYFLSMTSDGGFVAATSRLHPFLGNLLSSGCKRINPKFAIEDTAMSQCSGILRKDVYCDNIFILE